MFDSEGKIADIVEKPKENVGNQAIGGYISSMRPSTEGWMSWKILRNFLSQTLLGSMWPMILHKSETLDTLPGLIAGLREISICLRAGQKWRNFTILLVKNILIKKNTE